MNELRIGLVLSGLLLLAAIWYFGRHPRSGWRGWRGQRGGQPRYQTEPERAPANDAGGDDDAQASPERPVDGSQPEPSTTALGVRPHEDFERIITVHVAAKEGRVLRGADIVVAAEKVGLTFGHLDIFHRLIASAPERGPVFSVANLKKPNRFALDEIQTLETPALVFFLTLPAPLPALDAWDMLLPTAQRMAELLDAVLLDEQRSALTRQRIAGLRDDLRAFDRQHAHEAG